MHTIGLIGGMSWESSAAYYRLINEGVKARLGGFHSAKIVMWSVDFAEIEALQARGAWQAAGEVLAAAAQALEKAGADFVVICTNTMHKVATQIQDAVDIPLLMVTDVVAAAINAAGMGKIGLLGTRFTMHDGFYEELLRHHGVTTIVPVAADAQVIHDVIFQELVQGQITPTAKTAYLAIIERLASAGAEGIILGCTEIGLLINQADTPVRLFDSTVLHADAAVAKALGN